MKRFLLLLVAFIGFASCSDSATLNLEDDPVEFPTMLEQLQQRFDFSEVETEGLEIKTVYEAQSDIISNTFEYTHPELAVVIGEISNSLWLGLFDRESGKLEYQYTDIEHPVAYSAYGVEYEYEVGCIWGIYFDNNNVVLAIQYQYPKQESGSGKARLDLISFDVSSQKSYRTIITDNLFYDESGIQKIGRWIGNTVCLYFRLTSSFDDNCGAVIYDINEKETLCFICGNSWDSSFHRVIASRMIYRNDVLISNKNLLHFWDISFGEKLLIKEFQCTYDTVVTAKKEIDLFKPYTGDSSKEPLYSVEYKTRTDDHILVVVTQTEYDGTTTTKTVDVRIENDELKSEIQ